MQIITPFLKQIQDFKHEAHLILGTHEASKSRVILLEETYNQLGKMSLKQDELFRQALRCVENSLFRASHVMAWAGFIDFLTEILCTNHFANLISVRPNWKFDTIDELREKYTEFDVIEACKEAKVCSKGEKRILHGLLSKRNECAHPSNYYPELNETLGYISELFKRIEKLNAS
ncbi:hypothetical protein ACFLX7_00655 [Chloroflexota bacterium]